MIYFIFIYRLVLKDENKVSNIRERVQATEPGSEQARLFGKELSFVLPRDKVTIFPQLFQSVGSGYYEWILNFNYRLKMTSLAMVP